MSLHDTKVIVHDFKDTGSREELATGTPLLDGTYTIGDYLGADGFGITYLATDDAGEQVVVKECYPAAFCRRSEKMVQPRSSGHREEMASIVSIFVTEARRLSNLRHPNIVAVHNVFEENGTAYAVMDFVNGRDLFDLVPDDAGDLAPELVQGCLEKLLDGLAAVHRAGMLHRDISPDNIILRPNGDPVLIDFGTARGQATKASRILSVLRSVNDGYSPQEAYITGGEETPSCDLYSLAATFYHLITGELPAGSQLRVAAKASRKDDPYIPLGQRTDRYDALFCDAIDRAMSIVPRHRFASATSWLDALRPEPEDFDEPEIEDEIEDTPQPVAEAVVKPKRPVRELQALAAPDAADEDDGKISKFLTRFRRNASPAAAAEPRSADEDARPQSVAPRHSGRARGLALLSTVALIVGGVYVVTGRAPGEPTPFEVSIAAQPLDVATNTRMDDAPSVTAFTTPAKFALPQAPAASPAHETLVVAPAVTTAPDALALPVLAQSDVRTLDEITDLLSRTRPVPVITAPEPVVAVEASPVLAAAPQAPELPPALSISAVALFPFTADAADPSVIAAVDPGAPVWMTPGLRIVSVNGQPVASLADAGAIVTAEIAEGASRVPVTFGIEGRLSDQPVERSFDAPIVHDIILRDGLALRSTFDNGAWRTDVTEAGAMSTLRKDDRIIGVVENSLRLDGPLAIASILDAELAGDRTALAVAVERDEKLWVEVLGLSR